MPKPRHLGLLHSTGRHQGAAIFPHVGAATPRPRQRWPERCLNAPQRPRPTRQTPPSGPRPRSHAHSQGPDSSFPGSRNSFLPAADSCGPQAPKLRKFLWTAGRSCARSESLPGIGHQGTPQTRSGRRSQAPAPKRGGWRFARLRMYLWTQTLKRFPEPLDGAAARVGGRVRARMLLHCQAAFRQLPGPGPDSCPLLSSTQSHKGFSKMQIISHPV